jgi:hypothetical protein
MRVDGVRVTSWFASVEKGVPPTSEAKVGRKTDNIFIIDFLHQAFRRWCLFLLYEKKMLLEVNTDQLTNCKCS